MPIKTKLDFSTVLLALICLAGSFLLIQASFFTPFHGMPIEPGIFTEKIKIPFQYLNLGVIQLPQETENYLLFQNFESLPPIVQRFSTVAFGVITWILMSMAMVYISTFNRTYFIISAVASILLLLLSGINGLNIGAISSNYAFIILIFGMVGPAVVINTFFDHFSLLLRALIILPLALLTLPLLAALSPVADPYLLVSENISMLNMALSLIFFAYIGHSVITALFLMLVNLNKGVGIKITWHLIVLFLIYLCMLIFMYLEVTGNQFFGMPTPPVAPMLILVGILGLIEVNLKIDQIKQPFHQRTVGQSLYLIGFAIALLTYWKAEFSVNEPMVHFLEHGFIYTQIAFSMMFFAYLMANFSDLMNSGQSIEKIIFEPNFFAYFHMRLGSLIAMISLILFADGVIALQLGASSTNVTADYYYATERPLEAGILFENSWVRYRTNKKAKNASAHLKLAQNQTTLAIRELEESFGLSASVNDILLLSSTLHKQDKVFEAIFFLEKGQEIYPGNLYLKNNLALLQSKINQGEKAYQLLEEISGQHEVVLANLIGMKTKHVIRLDESLEAGENRMAAINLLAYLNLRGDYAPFQLDYQEEASKASITTRAILANQWSNKTTEPIIEDIALVDSLLAKDLSSTEEEEFRQIRVLRSVQGNHINQALKYLNGLAFNYPGSAGYYHHMASNIFAGQLDFEKAARQLIQAEEKGFRAFKSEHLPILYFANQSEKAFQIAEQHQILWPDWMVFHEQRLVVNEEVKFIDAMSHLNISTKDQFLQELANLSDEDLRAKFAYEIIWRKAHWLNNGELEALRPIVLNSPLYVQEKDFIEELIQLMITMDPAQVNNDKLKKIIDETQLYQNAYWTPFIFMAVDQKSDMIEQYSILQEATDFNRDPLLWIYLAKHSRMAGLDQYASEALRSLRDWIDDATLEALQIQHM